MPKYKPSKDTQYARLCIIGAGPAGLSAALNASSEGLDTIVLESQPEIGGQAKHSSRIENYMGFPSGLTGPELMSRAANQARKFGARIECGKKAVNLTREGELKCLTLSDGSHVISPALLLASGLTWRKLDCVNIDKFHGKGVFYGAAMDMGPQLQGKSVTIIGGANSAGQAAVWFSKFASVTMLVRGPSLAASMSDYLIQRIQDNPRIQVRFNTRVDECHGEDCLQSLTLTCTEGETTIQTEAMFIFIGAEPHTEWLGANCTRDSRGFLLSERDNATACAGIFCAGDVRLGSTKRVAAAVGDGAHSIASVHAYLASIGK